MVNRSVVPVESSRGWVEASPGGFRGPENPRIPPADMDGTPTMKAAAAAALALLGLGGAIGPALAEDVATFATPATQPEQAVAVELPRFVPSTEPVATIAPVVEPAMDLVPTPEEIVEDIPDGVASWYGARFAGRKTASGERFDPSEYTAAHRTLPFGS